MKLYVNFEKPRTVKEFLIKFYTLRNKEYLTYTVDRNVPCRTYYDKKCKSLQSSHTRRSFDDLYSLVTTYYPSITEKKLLHYLLTVKIKNYKEPERYCNYYIGICNDSKIVKYIPTHSKNSSVYLDISNNIDNKKLENSKYTCKTLLELLNIKTKQEFLDYINNH